MARILFVGAGDMTERMANGIAADGDVREIDLVDVSTRAEAIAAVLASSHDVTVRAHVVDARNPAEIATVLRAHQPDLIVQAAALMSPWALGGRAEQVAVALGKAGLGVRLPLQIPVLRATMIAAKDAGCAAPIANLSLPDLTNPILHCVGLAPTIGLGNVAMHLVRTRAALRAELGPDAEMPLLRLVGQHHHVYGVMQSQPPADPLSGPWVWVGESAQRRDELAYRGAPIAPGILYNAITASSVVPVLRALLPGAAPLRWSTPAPFGMLGGYPVRIDGGTITLDLPDGVRLDDCQQMCAAEARGDGIDHIDADGAVYFTDEAKAALGDVAPDLTEPLPLDQVDSRAQRILDLLAA